MNPFDLVKAVLKVAEGLGLCQKCHLHKTFTFDDRCDKCEAKICVDCQIRQRERSEWLKERGLLPKDSDVQECIVCGGVWNGPSND